MAKTKIITNGKLDILGLKKIGKSLLLTIGAAVLGFIGSSAGIIEYGSFNELAITFLPFIVNAGRKVLGKYESK